VVVNGRGGDTGKYEGVVVGCCQNELACDIPQVEQLKRLLHVPPTPVVSRVGMEG